MGDGTVLARVMREMHRRFATVPFYIVGKEISLEDVRLSLRRMADRFFEHPATVLVVTNMYYTEAPWLTPRAVAAATSMVWHEAALTGTTSHEFSEQIAALEPFLARNWQAKANPKSGNPMYEQPVALVLYRDDYRFLLNDVIPKRGAGRADYDMVIASQPYRLRAPLEFKAQKVVTPLVLALARAPPAGHPPRQIPGRDHPEGVPGRTVYPEPPRPAACRKASSARNRALQLHATRRAGAVPLRNAYAAHRDLDEHRHLDFVAAWNAAIYVAQIDDQLWRSPGQVALPGCHPRVRRARSLWFLDESHVVSRKRD